MKVYEVNIIERKVSYVRVKAEDIDDARDEAEQVYFTSGKNLFETETDIEFETGDINEVEFVDGKWITKGDSEWMAKQNKKIMHPKTFNK